MKLRHQTIASTTRWTLATTLAAMIGCQTTGDDQNYKLLDDEPHHHHEDPDPTPGAAVTPVTPESTAYAQPQPHPTEAPPADPQPTTAAAETPRDQPHTYNDDTLLTPIEEDTSELDAELDGLNRLARTTAHHQDTHNQPQPMADPTDAEHHTAESPMDRPSLRGLARSHWPQVTTGPARGWTTHNPIYFRDVPGGYEHRPDPDLPKLDMRLSSALDGAKPRNWNKWHSLALPIQPLKVIYDGIVAVATQHRNPTFSKVNTPEPQQPRRDHPNR